MGGKENQSDQEWKGKGSTDHRYTHWGHCHHSIQSDYSTEWTINTK